MVILQDLIRSGHEELMEMFTRKEMSMVSGAYGVAMDPSGSWICWITENIRTESQGACGLQRYYCHY